MSRKKTKKYRRVRNPKITGGTGVLTVIDSMNAISPINSWGAIGVNVPSACTYVKELIVDTAIVKPSPDLYETLVHLLVNCTERSWVRVPTVSALDWRKLIFAWEDSWLV